MDKLLSELEKQRRAENIYYSRRYINNNSNGNKYFDDTNENNDKKNVYRFFFKVLLFINLVIIIFCFQNLEYVFNREFISDVNLLMDNIKKRALSNEMYVEENIDNTIVSNEIVNNMELQSLDNEIKSVENITKVEEVVEKVNEKTDEEKEIEALIGMYQFKNPIGGSGVITSNFGKRNSDNENVSEYHTGIDIGAEYGTDIKSSVTGIVTLVSNVGDYGKQVRVRNNNVTTLYAHCSEILVKEGDIVADGQVIAKVGTSGNSTGPHLHFEIRVDDRCLDPVKLVKF